jgi:HAD superfamily hydrolase (TIGR01509 family)
MKKAYIFDLDGTLLDSMSVWADVDIAFLTKRGIPPPDDYADAISSMSFTECARYTIERFGLNDSVEDLLREWNESAKLAYADTVQMKPYAKEYLRLLRERDAKLAIATSTLPELCRLALSKHGISDWFDVICNSDEVGCGKSRPDIFLLCADRLGVTPVDCAVFEDILPAVKSAKSVGMTVYGVYDESSRSDWEEIRRIADYAVLDFGELFAELNS